MCLYTAEVLKRTDFTDILKIVKVGEEQSPRADLVQYKAWSGKFLKSDKDSLIWIFTIATETTISFITSKLMGIFFVINLLCSDVSSQLLI